MGYVDTGLSVQLKDIDMFWKKLDFEPLHLVNEEKESPTIDLKQHFQDFESAFKKEKNRTVKKSWLQKMRAIWDPSSTTYAEPKVQTKTRGRPKQQNKPDIPPTQPPLNRSYSTRPPRQSSYAQSAERDFNQEPRRHSSFRYPQYNETQSTWGRNSDDMHGYSSANLYNDTPFDPATQQTYYQEPSSSNFYTQVAEKLGFTQSGESSTFYEQDVAAEQSYFNDTSGPTYDKSNDYQLYIGQIPTVFHPHVQEIKNVRGDGNCGFRAVAYALGYGEDNWHTVRTMLIDEMANFKSEYMRVFGDFDYDRVYRSLDWSNGSAPYDYWMIMPWTGYVIANTFNVVVHSICKPYNGSSTIFPLWRDPKHIPKKKIITIAWVDGNHYVMVKLDKKSPIAITNNLWNKWKSPEAAGWSTLFIQRQNKYIASLNE